jgi:hypothetical protein
VECKVSEEPGGDEEKHRVAERLKEREQAC